MKDLKLLLTLPLLGMLAMPAMAGHDHRDDYREHRVEQRIDRQHARIKQGIRSGELTRKEAKRLFNEQDRIARMERKFTRDGYLDRKELRKLRRKLDDASDRIYRLKHNDRYRGKHADHDRYRDDHVHKRYLRDKRHDGYRRYDDGWSVVFSLVDRI